jgi:hypothetical protein
MFKKMQTNYGITKMDDNVEGLISEYCKNLICNIVCNGYHVATSCKMKTITLGHLNLVSQIQLKSIGEYPKVKTGGGHTVLPSEYFGIDSGTHNNDGNCMDLFQVDGGRAGIPSTFVPSLTGQSGGGNGQVNFISESDFKKYIKEAKAQNNNIKISKDALDIIMLSIELNIDMLMKFVQKRGIKILTVDKLSTIVNTKNRKFKHFTKN